MVRFRIDFGPGGVNLTRWVVRVLLDLDENADTGVPGVFLSGTPPIADAIGVDAYVTTNTLGDRVFMGPCTNRSTSGCVVMGGSHPMTVDGSSASFTIPLAFFGDDGRMAVKVVGYVFPGTEILDVMPDIGVPAVPTR